MSPSTHHRLGTFLSFSCGAFLLPILLFWGAGWFWAALTALTAATTLAALRHWRPSLFDAETVETGPGLAQRQEIARARALVSKETGFR